MTTLEKCEAILKNIVERCNVGADEDGGNIVVGFGPDWGGNSLTLFVGGSHTHIGSGERDYPFAQLIDRLHAWLLEGKGLSLAIPFGDSEKPSS